MDDITHYNLHEMSNYDAWNLPSWMEIKWPHTPSKQYILFETKQVKYPFACFFFQFWLGSVNTQTFVMMHLIICFFFLNLVRFSKYTNDCNDVINYI